MVFFTRPCRGDGEICQEFFCQGQHVSQFCSSLILYTDMILCSQNAMWSKPASSLHQAAIAQCDNYFTPGSVPVRQ